MTRLNACGNQAGSMRTLAVADRYGGRRARVSPILSKSALDSAKNADRNHALFGLSRKSSRAERYYATHNGPQSSRELS